MVNCGIIIIRVLLLNKKSGVADQPLSRLRLFYGGSYRFHLSGDNSRDRYIVILRALDRSVRGHLAASLDRPNPRPPGVA